MTQAMRLAVAALVVCATFVAPAASRQLKQTGNNLDFPGCTFFGDSEVFQNPDFSSLAAALQASGLNETLSNLTGYHTLFAPTNDAFAEFLAAANITAEDALSSNLNEIVLASHVVPGVVPGELLSDMDMITLPTLLTGANVTIMSDEVNSTEVVTVMSFGSEATIVTPASFACNLVIYGIDGVLVPEEALYPFESMTLVNYLTGTLMPGSAEVPLSLVVEAVESGETQAAAQAFMSAVDGGYIQQITALYVEATGNQEALVALAAVGNEVILMSSCDAYSSVLEQIPTTEELQAEPSTVEIVTDAYPALAECVTQSSSSP